MIGRLAAGLSPRHAGLLALALLVSMAILSLLGYRAIREWQHSATLLAERRADEAADLLTTALTRDMRAVQASVLSSQDWDEFMIDPPYDIRQLVAIAFARYPYPESFFAWRDLPVAGSPVFFTRAERPPDWMPARPDRDLFPVAVSSDATAGRRLIDRVAIDARLERRFSIFDMRIGDSTYQVVARLRYSDRYRLRLSSIFGFMVNLEWAKQHYLQGLATEVERVRGDSVVLRTVAQSASAPPAAGNMAVGQRQFSVMFFDPLSLPVSAPPESSRELWMAQALVVDDALRAVSLGANRALIMISVTGAVFAIGLALTVQVFRANAALVTRRADFVSSVTHELKTPVATIRAAGETLMSGRVTGPDTSREYARLMVEQAKRLTRLLNNLLAYARITDTTEGYAFEPVSLEPLAHESLRDWRWQLESGGFTVDIDVPPDVPSVRVDRTAFALLLDNLVANAIGHSTHTRSIRIRARRAPREVILEVADRGIGIPPDELALVTRKFFRGRGSIPGGSGLGLAIAERIVADHSGSLTIQSAVGVGTTVRVTLPIEEAHSA